MTAREVCQSIGCPDVAFKQWERFYTPAVNEVEARTLDGLIHHNSNPVMNWQMENVRMKLYTNGGKMPARPKNKDDVFKIDGAVALLMSVARYLENSAVPTGFNISTLSG